MRKLLVLLDSPHHRRHSLRFSVPLLLPVRQQILLRRPCRSLESRSTWERKLETHLEAAAVPCSEILPVVFPPHPEPRRLAAHPPPSWGLSSFLRALLPKHLRTVQCPVLTGFHEHLSISEFSVNNCRPCALTTLPLDKNVCFPVLCTLDILNTAVYSTFEVFLFPFFFSVNTVILKFDFISLFVKRDLIPEVSCAFIT
uniref:Cytochrome b5 type B n=1 Tax=Pipistrellus kuhlii TaxID=59472 RepID=A0A7J7UZN5_PIPKU|nr:cytochrome b5 type B [Pipistrellus kuhlii]